MLTAILLLSLDITPLLNRDVVAGERICDRAGLRTFYARRDARPAWDAAAHASLLRAVVRAAEVIQCAPPILVRDSFCSHDVSMA